MKKQDLRKRTDEAALLEEYAGLLVGTSKEFRAGARELSSELRNKWDFALKSHADALMGWVLFPIITRDKSMGDVRLAEMILGADNKYTQLGADWAAVTAKSGYIPQVFSRPEGRKSLDALSDIYAKEARTATGTADDAWVGLVKRLSNRRTLGVVLEKWIEHEYPFGDRQSSSREEKKAGVAAAITEMSGSKPADRKQELTAQIAQLEADMKTAKDADEFDKAKELKGKLDSTKAELAKLEKPVEQPAVTPPPAEQPATPATPTVEAKPTDELAAAIEFCTSPTAGKGAKLFYARWERDDIDDTKLVESVKALMA